MQYAVESYIDIIKFSHFYVVFCNDSYPARKLFIYSATFDWLNTSNNELGSVLIEPDSAKNNKIRSSTYSFTAKNDESEVVVAIADVEPSAFCAEKD